MLHLSLLASITPAIQAVIILYASAMALQKGTILILGSTDYAAFFIFAYVFAFINFWVQQVYKSGVGKMPRVDKIVSYLMSTAIGLIFFFVGDLWCVNSSIDYSAFLLLSATFAWTSVNRFRIYRRKSEFRCGETPLIPIKTKHLWECELRFNKKLIKFSTYGARIFISYLLIALFAQNSIMVNKSIWSHLLTAFGLMVLIDAIDIIVMFIVIKLFEKSSNEKKQKHEEKPNDTESEDTDSENEDENAVDD